MDDQGENKKFSGASYSTEKNHTRLRNWELFDGLIRFQSVSLFVSVRVSVADTMAEKRDV
jgi:hypothetical protein